MPICHFMGHSYIPWPGPVTRQPLETPGNCWSQPRNSHNQVYCQVGFHIEGICLGVLVHNINVVRDDKKDRKQVLQVYRKLIIESKKESVEYNFLIQGLYSFM